MLFDCHLSNYSPALHPTTKHTISVAIDFIACLHNQNTFFVGVLFSDTSKVHCFVNHQMVDVMYMVTLTSNVKKTKKQKQKQAATTKQHLKQWALARFTSCEFLKRFQIAYIFLQF